MRYTIAQDEKPVGHMENKEHALDYAERLHCQKPEAITTVRDASGKVWAFLTTQHMSPRHVMLQIHGPARQNC